MAAPLLKGSILRLIMDKGFGFIKGDDGQEYFFHRSAMKGGVEFESLQMNDKVSFFPSKGPKGSRAEQVSLEE